MAHVINQQLHEADFEFLGGIEGTAKFVHAKHIKYMIDGAQFSPVMSIKSKCFDEWEDDDGWRDFTTGDRIATSSDRMVITQCPEETLTVLKLRYLDTLVPMSIQYE